MGKKGMCQEDEEDDDDVDEDEEDAWGDCDNDDDAFGFGKEEGAVDDDDARMLTSINGRNRLAKSRRMAEQERQVLVRVASVFCKVGRVNDMMDVVAVDAGDDCDGVEEDDDEYDRARCC